MSRPGSREPQALLKKPAASDPGSVKPATLTDSSKARRGTVPQGPRGSRRDSHATLTQPQSDREARARLLSPDPGDSFALSQSAP
ncbi:hypothetical protein AAFF_G00105270 [Aldrovandia affinis]|uniref:Uncharacterized protein n=1 Tax=Aldrovandia affinis TaxID=143900 RepID=A0AAD7T2E0_9TELE|nr:hypothetical protein AAFF_G00105270 [Aldrovandia affinis]